MSFSPKTSRTISRFMLLFRMLKFNHINDFFPSFLISKNRYHSMSMLKEMESPSERKQPGLAIWRMHRGFFLWVSPLPPPTSWVSKIIRKMFAPSRFWTLDAKISWSKGHFVFLWVNMHGAKWNILFTSYTPHLMDTETVSVIF